MNDTYSVYFYRAWIDSIPNPTVKIGYSSAVGARVSGIRQYASTKKFTAIDDTMKFVIDDLTKVQAITLEAELHEALTHFKLGPVLGKEWFCLSESLLAGLVAFVAKEYGKKVTENQPSVIKLKSVDACEDASCLVRIDQKGVTR